MLYIIPVLFVQLFLGAGGEGEGWGKYFPDTQAWPHKVLIYAKFIKSSCRQS